MALFKSASMTQASGSVGGMTYSHNRSGMYMRARTIPVNPNTTPQQEARSILSNLSSEWSTVLTNAQRDAWKSYAEATPVVNALGDPVVLTGQQMYVRCNAVKMQAGLVSVAAAPSTPGGASLTPTLSQATTGTPADGETAYTNTDVWATAVGGALLIFVSRPQSAGVNFFKGPFLLASVELGAVVPPVSPQAWTSPFAGLVPVGAVLFVRTIAVEASAKISAAQIERIVVGA